MTLPDAWMNGEFIDYQKMAVPVWDLGVVAGASIAEMARTFRHRTFRLDQHLNRLMESCDELRFPLPYVQAELVEAAEEVVARNARGLATDSDLGIVIFATAGANPTYLGEQPLPGATVGIHTFELPFNLWRKSVDDGVRLVVPAIRQHDQRDLPVHRKVRNRLHWWLADRQANEISAGAKAVLLDHQDRITETSTSAFYAVIDSTIVTPAENVLDSMSRRMVCEAASAAGIEFRIQDLRLEDLKAASECFVSSTPVGILPVAAVNGHSLPVDSRESVVPLLLEFWLRQTGVNPKLQIQKSA